MKTIDANTIINREKLSPLQWMVFILGFFVFFCDGLDTGIIGFVAPALLDDWGITKPQLAPVLSAALVGMSIGAIISGPLADKFGRKGVIVFTSLLFSIFTILCGFANSTQDLMIYRFITGVGLGAAMPNISTIVSEYMPVKRKAFLTGLAGCGFMLGISCGGEVQQTIITAYEEMNFHVVCSALTSFCINDLGGFYLDIIKDRQYTTKADSQARRSAQTALYHIVQAFIRWMSPILSFTAQEAWPLIPEQTEKYVFTSEWYDLPVSSKAKELCSAMNKLHSLH